VIRIKSAQPTELILNVSVPFGLSDANHDHTVSTLSSLSIPRALSTAFIAPGTSDIESLKWALQQGVPVDIDVQAQLSNEVFEKFEEILTKATDLPEGTKLPPIILCEYPYLFERKSARGSNSA
jgi:hypothetical protein